MKEAYYTDKTSAPGALLINSTEHLRMKLGTMLHSYLLGKTREEGMEEIMALAVLLCQRNPNSKPAKDTAQIENC